MHERGFSSITVQDIGERAGINRATFYAHFSDKHALFDHQVRETFRADLDRALPQADAFNLEHLPRLVRVVVEILAHVNSTCGPRGAVGAPPIEGIVQDEVQSLVRSWLRSRKSRAGRRQAGVETAALVTSAGIIGAGLAWSRAEKRVPIDQIVREICNLLAPGLE
jgi:AcrR family transcriptional regulator